MNRVVFGLAFTITFLFFPILHVSAVDSTLVLRSPILNPIQGNIVRVDLLPQIISSEWRFEKITTDVCDISISNCGSSGYEIPNEKGMLEVPLNDNFGRSKVHIFVKSENELIYSVMKRGNFNISISKIYSRDVQGRSVREYSYHKILIPIEIINLDTDGILIGDLKDIGINAQPNPILKCPTKIENRNQNINCQLSYYYSFDNFLNIPVIVNESESFQICAFKDEAPNYDRCADELKPYFFKTIKIDFRSKANIKIPSSKNSDTFIYVHAIEKNEAENDEGSDFQYYFNKPKKYSNSNSNKSKKWVRKCSLVTVTEQLSPGDLTNAIVSGNGSSNIVNKKFCRNVLIK